MLLKNHNLLLVFILIVTIISCSKKDATPGVKDTGGAGATFNVDKSILLKRVNDIRAAGCTCGSTAMPPVSPITWNDQLATAAYAHSVDMDQKNYFSHTGSDGSNAGQRITAAGYSWKSYGENIAKGPLTEDAVINGWLSSEGHCKNIMSAGAREMGVGRSSAYWTQVFGSR